MFMNLNLPRPVSEPPPPPLPPLSSLSPSSSPPMPSAPVTLSFTAEKPPFSAPPTPLPPCSIDEPAPSADCRPTLGFSATSVSLFVRPSTWSSAEETALSVAAFSSVIAACLSRSVGSMSVSEPASVSGR